MGATRIVRGLENLKDEFRKAKLNCGDLRGLKNRFQISERLGVNQLQTFFFAAGGGDGLPTEIEVEIARNKYDSGFHEYSMKDMVSEVKNRNDRMYITLHARTYTSKHKTDSNSKTVAEFYYRN